MRGCERPLNSACESHEGSLQAVRVLCRNLRVCVEAIRVYGRGRETVRRGRERANRGHENGNGGHESDNGGCEGVLKTMAMSWRPFNFIYIKG